MLGLLAILSAAVAVPPDRAPELAEFSARGGRGVTDLVISADGYLLAGLTGADDEDDAGVFVLDAATWTAATSAFSDEDVSPAACDATSVALARRDVLAYYVFVGCADGTIQSWRWNNQRLTLRGIASDDDALVYTVSDDGDPVIALRADPTENYIYALVDADGLGGTTVHKLAYADDGTLTGANYSVSGAFATAAPRRITWRAGTGAGQIVVSHADGQFSSWSLGSGSGSVGSVVSLLAPFTSVTPTDLGGHPSAGAYFVEQGKGRVGQWTGTADQASVSILASGLTAPRAVSAFTASDNQPYILVASEVSDTPRVNVYTSLVAPAVESIPVAFTVTDLLPGPPDVVFASTDDGTVRVVTRLPFLRDVAVSPDEPSGGDTVTVSFETDTPGDWEIQIGGLLPGEGDELLTGTAAEAGVVSVDVTLPEDLSDDRLVLWVLLTDDAGRTGSAAAPLTVDNPPGTLRLGKDSVGFGDRKIILRFDALSASDITGYLVYLSTTPFTPEQFSTGGPTGEYGRRSFPLSLDQPDSGDVALTIDRLTNEVTYYLAIRSKDASGEGPMSNVVSVTPHPTMGASGRTGEEGGPPPFCAAAPGASGVGALALVGAAALLRRRRGLAVVALLGLSGSALAQDLEIGDDAQVDELPGHRKPSLWVRDTTKAWGNFEFLGGSYAYKSSDVKSLYGNRGADFRLQVGAQIFRYGEVDIGVGLVTKKGNTVGADGSISAENIRLQMAPFSLDGTLRAHVVDEQPIVPFAGAGVDWIFWRETPLDADNLPDPDGRTVGSKLGWHWHAGANILLDWIQPGRASELEARTGINDTWLTLQFRQQIVGKPGDDAGLNLDGWTFSGGLKIDY